MFILIESNLVLRFQLEISINLNCGLVLFELSYIFSISQELQRRLDQTLGKPGSYLAGIDRVGNVKPMTVGARLYRVEQQLSVMDKKLDHIMHALNGITMQRTIASAVSTSNLTAALNCNPQQGQLQYHPQPQNTQQPVQQQQQPSLGPESAQSSLQLPSVSPTPTASPSPMKCLEDDV